MRTTDDSDLDLGVVHNILDSVWPEGLIEGHRDKIVVVADHLRDEPLRAVKRPDTKGPAVQLGVAEDGLVDLHDTASKSIDTLIDLTVRLPCVSAPGLSRRVVAARTEHVLVLELCQCCYTREE